MTLFHASTVPAGTSRTSMPRGRRIARLVIVLAAGLGLALTVPQGAHAASSSARDGARVLIGTWVGTNTGYENGTYVKRQVRFVITKAKGRAFVGTKNWREVGASTWEGPVTFQGVLMPTGEFRASDSAGYEVGTLVSPDALHVVYMEAGDSPATFLQMLTRQGTRGR